MTLLFRSYAHPSQEGSRPVKASLTLTTVRTFQGKQLKNPHLHLINVLQEGNYAVFVIKLGIKHYLMCPQRFTSQKKAGVAFLFQSDYFRSDYSEDFTTYGHFKSETVTFILIKHSRKQIHENKHLGGAESVNQNTEKTDTSFTKPSHWSHNWLLSSGVCTIPTCPFNKLIHFTNVRGNAACGASMDISSRNPKMQSESTHPDMYGRL